jgi:hypothetical protein
MQKKTKLVEMAKWDEKTDKLVTGRQEVPVERVTIKHNGQGADRVLNDVVAGRVVIARGATVGPIEMSTPGVNDLRKGMEAGAALELVVS